MKSNARNEILAGLMRKGFSFRSWSVNDVIKPRKYNPRTVAQVVTRITRGSKIRGALSLQIIADLEKTIGKTIFH